MANNGDFHLGFINDQQIGEKRSCKHFGFCEDEPDVDKK